MMNVRIFIHEMYDRTEKPSKSTIRNQKKSSTFCSYTHTSNFGRLIVGYSRLQARARDAPAQILTRSHRGMVLTCLIVQRDWLGHKCCSDVHGLFKQSSIRKPKKKKNHLFDERFVFHSDIQNIPHTRTRTCIWNEHTRNQIAFIQTVKQQQQQQRR